jgi:hypothetical protein
MDITKVKFSEGKTIVTYTVDASTTTKETTVSSSDPIHPDLRAAMDGLVPEARRMLKLPKEWEESMKVLGISLSYAENQGLGAVVTLAKSYEDINAPLIINTPHCHEGADGQNVSLLPQTFQAQIRTVIAEAREFVRGKRETGNLFDAENNTNEETTARA